MSDEFNLKEGDAPVMLSAAWWSKKLSLLRALSKLDIKEGTAYRVDISDQNIIITVKRQNTVGQGMVFRDDYDATVVDYIIGNVVRVSPVNPYSTTLGGETLPGVYICVQPPSDTDFPKHPLQDGGETAFWKWLSTWPSVDESKCVAGEPVRYAADSQPLPEE